MHIYITLFLKYSGVLQIAIGMIPSEFRIRSVSYQKTKVMGLGGLAVLTQNRSVTGGQLDSGSPTEGRLGDPAVCGTGSNPLVTT